MGKKYLDENTSMTFNTNTPSPDSFNDKKRLNVGCGVTPTAGWRNYDNTPGIRWNFLLPFFNLAFKTGLINKKNFDKIVFSKQNNIMWANVGKRIPESDESVDVIYTSHMLEHMTRREAQKFVNESLRVLCQGGILRISVPDLKKFAVSYVEGGEIETFIAQLNFFYPGEMGWRHRLSALIFGWRGHNWMYDGESLCALLTREGFSEARVMPAGETTIADPGTLNLRERENQSVYVEAVKPAHERGRERRPISN